MNSTDMVLFNQAVSTAQNGNKDFAYQQFSALVQVNNNHTEPDLLIWLAYTTPNTAEAYRALDEVSKINPNYPGLNEARSSLSNRLMQQQAISPPQSYTQPQTYNQPQAYMQPQPQPYYAPPPQVINIQQNAMGMGTHACPYCHSVMMPRYDRRVSTAGWVVFTVLLFTTLIFCFIGLLIKEDQRFCTICGRRI